MKTEPRIILFDLESLPNLPEVMKVFCGLSAYPGLTMKASINTIICFGYQVFGEETRCVNAWDFSSWKRDVNDDLEVVKRAREILQDADAIVTHNGRRFDLKFLQTRLLYHGLDPLPKIPHIDTCSIAKSHLLLFNNKMNTLAKFMTSEEKLENGGWELWVKVLNKDKEACKLMEEYCMQDVRTLNAVFKRLRPLISNLPNYNVFNPLDKPVCPQCGSTRLQKNGKAVRGLKIAQRHICTDCRTNLYTQREDRPPKVL